MRFTIIATWVWVLAMQAATSLPDPFVASAGAATRATGRSESSQPQESADKDKGVLASARCGDWEMFLRSAGGESNETTLHLRKSARSIVDLSAPKEMKGQTAVGIGCAKARDGVPYFVVEYGELPWGCSFCEWLYLYDRRGVQLTTSIPPVRVDGDTPGQSAQRPNNEEFDELTEELGIDVRSVELDYVRAE